MLTKMVLNIIEWLCKMQFYTQAFDVSLLTTNIVLAQVKNWQKLATSVSICALQYHCGIQTILSQIVMDIDSCSHNTIHSNWCWNPKFIHFLYAWYETIDIQHLAAPEKHSSASLRQVKIGSDECLLMCLMSVGLVDFQWPQCAWKLFRRSIFSVPQLHIPVYY